MSKKEQQQLLRREEVKDSIAHFAVKYMDAETYGFCLILLELLSQFEELGFQRGKKEIWAAAIVLSVVRCNFMLDKNEDWWVTVDEIAEHCGANKSTFSQKSTNILNSLSEEFVGKFLTRACFQGMFEVEYINGFMIPVNTDRDDDAEPLETEHYAEAKLLFESFENEFGKRITRRELYAINQIEALKIKQLEEAKKREQKEQERQEELADKKAEMDHIQPSLFEDF